MDALTETLDRPTILSIVMISVLASLLTLGIPIAAQTLINLIAFGKVLQPVFTLGMIVLVLMLALGALSIWQLFIIEIVQQKLMVKTSLQLTRQFTSLSLDNFSTHHGPELVNRFFEITTIQKSVGSILLYGINLCLQLLFGLLLLAIYHPWFMVFDSFILVSIFLAISLPYRKGLNSAKEECAQKHRIGAWLEEILINRFLFRFGYFSQFATQQTDRNLVFFLNARKKHFRQLVKHEIGFYILSAFAASVLLVIGGYLVIQNQLSLGQLVAAEIVVGTIIYALKRFGVILQNYYDLMAASSKVKAIMELPREQERTDLDALLLPLRTIGIHLSGNPEKVVAAVKNPLLVYSADPDQCIHLADCLSGFAEHPDLSIFVNGTLCNRVHLAGLRHHGLVIRRPEWIAGTIRDNLRLNQKNISSAKILEALEDCELTSKIIALPEGLNTAIYDWQTGFTQHELLELTLIRAMLLEPALLIIDRALDEDPGPALERCMKRLLSMEKTIILVITQNPEFRLFDNRWVLQ